MRLAMAVTAFGLLLSAGAGDSFAQTSGAPGVITEGSGSVSIGGQSAARKGDRTDQGSAIVEGSPNVFINGKPAARLGDRDGCGGVTIRGGSGVFVNGRPAAGAGSTTSGCASK